MDERETPGRRSPFLAPRRPPRAIRAKRVGALPLKLAPSRVKDMARDDSASPEPPKRRG